MNKTAIKNFAIWARNKLIADIKYKAGLMGITEKGIAGALPQSAGGTEFYDIGTSEPYCISGKEIEQRRRLKEVIENKATDTDYATAYKYVIEEVAYTWFNRLIAVRFMEVNDYLPGHIRVLSSETGKMEPDLVTTPFDADLEFTSTEEEKIIQLKQDNKIDELFRMLFIKQCNALNELLPALFEKTNDYTEILLNLSVIDQEGVIYRLVHDIPEEDFDVNRGGQVEIIGWLYQYYNTEPKNEAFAKKGKITKEELPAVTQLFTPDWIVRYMVENSLGRLWLEGHPDDNLKAKWKYYLDEAEQEPEVNKKLDEIKEEYKKLNPEDIKLIDPCMGSGHILVYAFDVLMQIYESVGYTQREAAKSILKNNLYGLDIDDRAFQMAYFAIFMKARQYNRRIFDGYTRCNIYSIQESNRINRKHLSYMGIGLSEEEKNSAISQINLLLDDMKDAKEFGSILQIKKYNFDIISRFLNSVDNNMQIHFDTYGLDETRECLLYLVQNAKVLSDKYDVAITNPPYMGSGNMGDNLLNYIKKNYKESKADLFAVMMTRLNAFLKECRYGSMIVQHVWMFLSRFEEFRNSFMANDIVNMAHLGARAFDDISGEVVQTTSFVFRHNEVRHYRASYLRLLDYSGETEKEKAYLKKEKIFTICKDEYYKIPGSPLAYWASENLIDGFSGKQLGTIATIRQGLATGDNDKFLRLWYEPAKQDVKFECSSLEELWEKKGKYVPLTKGGSYRKWYGNNDYVIAFDESSYNLLAKSGNNLPSRQLYFKEGITWSNIAVSATGFRKFYQGYAFSNKGAAIFTDDKNLEKVLIGFLNSKITMELLLLISPSIGFEPGYIASLSLKDMDTNDRQEICELVDQCIGLSKEDWDSFEYSWDFRKHPLVGNYSTINEAYSEWEKQKNIQFLKLKKCEERINEIFIKVYNLETEMTSNLQNDDITINKASLQADVKSLLSYAVGCMFGRYSLDEEGLVCGGKELEPERYSSYSPDRDNVIPITDEEYFEDDIVGLFCTWLKSVYGEETLEENLDFIAKALGKKGNSSREIIRNYFLTDFYKDHCSTYSVTGSGKRPIYWLFDSGKQNGFKALIYLHRYTPDTIGNLRVDYLHRMQRVYESEMNRMQDMIEHSTNSREVASASKRKEKLQKQLKECREYDEKIGHLALDRIELDLDDGVKYNYRKIQTGRDGKFYEVLADSKAIMMDAKKYADFKK